MADITKFGIAFGRQCKIEDVEFFDTEAERTQVVNGFYTGSAMAGLWGAGVVSLPEEMTGELQEFEDFWLDDKVTVDDIRAQIKERVRTRENRATNLMRAIFDSWDAEAKE